MNCLLFFNIRKHYSDCSVENRLQTESFGRRDNRKEKTPRWLELRWQHSWCREASDGVCWWTGCETWKRRVSSFPPLCHFQSVLTVFQCNQELGDTYMHIWKLFPNILKVFGLNIFFFLQILFFFLICGGFCHTLKGNSHGFTCVPHPDPLSHLPLHPLPLGFPSAAGPSACLMHPTWAGDLFHPR